MPGTKRLKGLEVGLPRSSIGLRADSGLDTNAVRGTGVRDTLLARPDHVLLGGGHGSRFIERNGVAFAGTHLIIDLWGAKRLDELEHIEAALRNCVAAAGATLLHIHLHQFSLNAGVSGVAVLAESHISIHTWPECEFAALDVFMCGDAKPHATIEVLKRAFSPKAASLSEHKRGVVA